MRTAKFLLIVVVITVLATCGIIAAAADSPKPGENLLQAPSFEEYWQWNTWYYSITVQDAGKGHPVDSYRSFGTPYFGPSESKWDKERPRQDEGWAGEVSGEAYWQFRAGYYQTVDAPPGTRVRFSVWVNGFCEDERTNRCPVILKAGIDPTGGYDWQSNTIQWVETNVSDQKYVQLATEATVGPTGSVTVFTWGEPTYAVLYTAAYFDEASLVIVPASGIAPVMPMSTPQGTLTSAAAPATVPEVVPATKPDMTPTPIPVSPDATRGEPHSDDEDQVEDGQ
jgi:hypothetical protein